MKRILPIIGVAIGAMLLSSCGPAKVVQPQATAKDSTDAYVLLLRSADDQDAMTRCAAIEALADVRGERASKVYLQALRDESPPVRFAAAMAIGKCRIAEAKPRLVAMAEDKKLEPNKLVYIGVIYALYRLGDIQYCVDLAGLLLEDRAVEVRGTAAEIMGLMGERSAIRPLKFLHDQEVNAPNPQARWQAAEALARLGDSLGENLIAGYTRSAFQDEKLFGTRAMEQIVRPRFVPALEYLLSSRQQVPAVKVIAGAALARQGQFRQDVYDLCIQSLQDPQRVFKEAGVTYEAAQMLHETNKLQILSAIALADMHRQSAVEVLRPAMQSPSGQVRIAAARGILMLMPDAEAVRDIVVPDAARASSRPAAATRASSTQPSSRPAAGQLPRRPILKTAGAKD